LQPQQRTALITGAGSGIGAAIARRFLQADYAVALFDLNGEAAAKVVADQPVHSKWLIVQGDAAEDLQVRNSVIKITEELGPIDVLVNNVGIETNGTVLEQSLEQWDRQMAVNLRSTFLFGKYCVPGMRAKRYGVIINIASIHAYASWPRCVAYDTTKSGLLGLTRAMAIDHGPEGIRVNAICPGYIRTPLLQEWFAAVGGGEEAAARVHPLRRIGEPVDVANAALFLASDDASFITAACLTVDGGLVAAGQ
jgi:NAD(P)-dependent dehydrogenase (short-subunit alcohol dehydrogenase family)